MKLSECKVNDVVIVEKILFTDKLRDRMLSIGLVNGTQIEILRNGPKNNLTVYKFRNTKIAFRKEESDLILVKK